MKPFFKFLLIGAMRKQRGDHTNIYFSRAAFWLSLSTSLYLTSIAHWLLEDQFRAFSKMKGEGLFSIKSFDGSYLMAGVLTVLMFISFFFLFYPQIIDEFKATQKKGARYSLFLLYFLASFAAFIWSQGFIRDTF